MYHMASQNVFGKLEDAVDVLVTEVNHLGTENTDLRTKLAAAVVDIAALRATLLATQADVASLYTAHDGHVHSGVTVGAGNSGATTAAATAKSSAAPSAVTATAPAAISHQGLKKTAV